MKKGFQQYTVRDLLKSKVEALQVFKQAKAMGYDSIHGCPIKGIFTLEEYKGMINEAGLEDCACDGSFETMRQSGAGIKKVIEEAHFLGDDQISIGTLPKEYRESKEGYQRYARELNAIAKELKKEGLKMIYHPHALEFFSLGGGLKGMDIIFEETDPEGLWFCLDTHWLAAGGVSPAGWIHKVKGRMKIIHFKDYAIVKAAMDNVEEVHKQFAEIGEGNLDWPEIIGACNDIGVEHAVVEQDICPGNPLDSLKKSIDNMKKMKIEASPKLQILEE